jgi:hypothetical protein
MFFCCSRENKSQDGQPSIRKIRPMKNIKAAPTSKANTRSMLAGRRLGATGSSGLRLRIQHNFQCPDHICQIEQNALQVVIISGSLRHQCRNLDVSQRILPSAIVADASLDTHLAHHSYSPIDQPSAFIIAQSA